MKHGIDVPIPFWTPFVILALWLGYERDWFALILLAPLGYGYRLFQKAMMQLFRAGARETVKPSWWDNFVDIPHPSDQSHSADLLRYKYRRAVRRVYP